MNLDYIRALHIIFVVTWFAGLFYIVRLFIYHREAQDKEEKEKEILSKQYKIMQSRLWFGITWPSVILTYVFGLWMWGGIYNFSFIHKWLLVKLGFVVLLTLYHLSLHYIFNRFKKGNFKYTSTQLRMYNEVAVLFLFAIVFLVELKNILSFAYGTIGLVILSVMLMLAIRIYKKVREGKNNPE